MTYEEQVKKWQAAMDKTMKRALSQKGGVRKLMVRAGILERGGKRLAKRYR
jgi:hypothetical protein